MRNIREVFQYENAGFSLNYNTGASLRGCQGMEGHVTL